MQFNSIENDQIMIEKIFLQFLKISTSNIFFNKINLQQLNKDSWVFKIFYTLKMPFYNYMNLKYPCNLWISL